jgi:ATP-dependent DNA helicase RecG
VRYRGRVWVRDGPRIAIASPDDERRLAEKRRSKDISYDLQPVYAAAVKDLDLETFRRIYLPAAVSFETLQANNRPIKLQLASLRFTTPDNAQTPTVLGILTVGNRPRDFLYGAYVQFVRVNGTEVTDPIINQKQIDEPLPDLLRLLDDLIEINSTVSSTIIGNPIENKKYDYPIEALHQIIRNAILHRTYESNAPVRINWFTDRIEIYSPGGLFGEVNRDNFGSGVTSYRNPHIAEAMKNLGYVQQFGFGIPIAKKLLKENGNPPLEFQIRDNNILVIVRNAL